MALKDLLNLVDDKLRDVFSKPVFDADKARAPILKSIGTTRTQFASPTPTKGRKAFKVANGVVEYTPPVAVNGKSTLFIPQEHFTKALNELEGAVKAGELDEALKAGYGPRSAASADIPRLRASTGGSGRAGKPLDPEKVHARNVSRYGAERADALWLAKHGKARTK